ncbi:MAG: DUF4878 domain-containing protein [Spirochaetota bacterium]|nr:DUF4878 domain-containing protein [Spirochaetota bacterium]
MKIIQIISNLTLIISLISCSNNKPRDVIENIQDLYKAGKFKEVRKYYTKGSNLAMDELEKLIPKSKNYREETNKKFANGAEWEVISENIYDTVAEVKIKYNEHPVENMKGLEVQFSMKKEDNMWKINNEDDLKMSIEMIKKMNEQLKSFIK